MASTQMNVKVPDQIINYIKTYPTSTSDTVRMMINHYAAFIAAAPALTEREWLAIIRAIKNCGFPLSHEVDQSGMMIPIVGQTDGNEKLISKLSKMEPIELIAIWDIAVKCWMSQKDSDLSSTEWLRRCGAKIA